MKALYPHQITDINRVMLVMPEHQRVLLVAPTGYGKTVAMSWMIRELIRMGKRVLILLHRAELITQTCAMLADFGIEFGVIWRDASDSTQKVLVASVQTLARRDQSMPIVDFIFIDEAHHAVAGSWLKILDRFPNTLTLGLTATPARLDGKGLKKVFRAMVVGPTVKELITGGYLSPYTAYVPPCQIDFEGLKVSDAGDYERNELDKRTNKPHITGDAIEHYQRLCSGQKALAFCVTVEHARQVAECASGLGIPARAIDGTMEADERAEIVEEFRQGDLLWLVSVELLGEGFDVPAASVAILLRKTRSVVLHRQQLGRVLRFERNKTATILDHVGNVMELGLPDGDDYEWSLDGATRKRKNAPPAVRQCSMCYAAFSPRISCPRCGFVFEKQEREIVQADGTLIEMSEAEWKKYKKKKRSEALTRPQLIAIARKKGLKYPEAWADWVLQKREEKKNKVS